MIGRVHRRVQCFGGNRSEAVPASGFGSENNHHQDEDEEDMDEDFVEVHVLSKKTLAKELMSTDFYTNLCKMRFVAICAKLERNTLRLV